MTAIKNAPSARATTDLDAELQALVQESLDHPAVQHPLLRRFARGSFGDAETVLFQYAWEASGYVAWAPNYLKAAMARLPEPEHRLWLWRSLEIEQGQLSDNDRRALRTIGISPKTVDGIPRSELFGRFCARLGITDVELQQPTAAAEQWRCRLLRCLYNATPAEAVGALVLGTEWLAKPIHEQLLTGILGIGHLRRDAFAFFELSCLVDEQHRHDLRTMVLDLAAAPGGLAELRRGMLAALQLRCAFYDHLYRGVIAASLADSA